MARGGNLKEINLWFLAAEAMTLGMVYITCFRGILMAFRKKTWQFKWRLIWGLLFVVGLAAAMALTFPILAVLFGF